MVGVIIGSIVGSFMGCWLYALTSEWVYKKRQEKYIQIMCQIAEEMEKENDGQQKD